MRHDQFICVKKDKFYIFIETLYKIQFLYRAKDKIQGLKTLLKDEGRLKKVFFSCKPFYYINRINHFSEIRNVVFH